MMKKDSDRRRRVRVPVQQHIRHSRYQVLGTPVFEENSSVDLSSNGISFYTSQDYKKGSLILLEFAVGNEPLKLLVCVAWIRKSKESPEKFHVGAELIAIDPEHKKQMQGHLSKLIQQLPVKVKAKAKNKKKTGTKTKPKTPVKKKKTQSRKRK